MDPLYGQRTTYPKKSDLNYSWVLIDAENLILGRLASKVANILMGKEKSNYIPGQLVGDSVIIINAKKIRTTGNKVDQKEYFWHSGFVGGIKSRTYREQMEKFPERILESAIKGMLPKNKYGNSLMRRLRIFPNENHGMQAQQPKELKNIKI